MIRVKKMLMLVRRMNLVHLMVLVKMVPKRFLVIPPDSTRGFEGTSRFIKDDMP